MPKEKAELVEILKKGNNEDEEAAIQKVFDKGMSVDDIKVLISNFAKGGEKDHSLIFLSKISRTQEEIDYDDNTNIYAFIGYTGKKPIEINGKTYYEDKFAAEVMIKLEKFNPGSLSMISGMHMRKVAQNYPNSGVYLLKVSKDVMDEDRYDGIPEGLEDLVDQFKTRA